MYDGADVVAATKTADIVPFAIDSPAGLLHSLRSFTSALFGISSMKFIALGQVKGAQDRDRERDI